MHKVIKQELSAIARSAAGGFLATVPMSAAMFAWRWSLPWYERYRLPPRQITGNLLGKLGMRHQLSETATNALATALHFGYGTAIAAPYGVLDEHVPLPPPVKGAAYGLAVWAGSYLGLLPALGLLSPATRHPRDRIAMMVGAHLIWGIGLGVIADRLRQPAPPSRLTKKDIPHGHRTSRRSRNRVRP